MASRNVSLETDVYESLIEDPLASSPFVVNAGETNRSTPSIRRFAALPPWLKPSFVLFFLRPRNCEGTTNNGFRLKALEEEEEEDSRVQIIDTLCSGLSGRGLFVTDARLIGCRRRGNRSILAERMLKSDGDGQRG